MILFIDSGNTRAKWRLVRGAGECLEGSGPNSTSGLLSELSGYGPELLRVVVSTVGSEEAVAALKRDIEAITDAPAIFHWAERTRFGLHNSYSQVTKMGADRWHAMVAAWHLSRRGLAVIDAGSAVTIDYVDDRGRHLGGYILPGLQMMRRSLKVDAARIGFSYTDQLDTRPGNNTSECTNNGLAWMNLALIERIQKDVERYGLYDVFVTGGDADRLLAQGLKAVHRPGLVFDGLALIDQAEAG